MTSDDAAPSTDPIEPEVVLDVRKAALQEISAIVGNEVYLGGIATARIRGIVRAALNEGGANHA